MIGRWSGSECGRDQE